MSQEEDPRDPGGPNPEGLEPETGPPGSGDAEPVEADEPEVQPPSSKPIPTAGASSGPRLHALPPNESAKRRSEFQAGSDLSDLLAKKQLDFDTELRRRPEVRSVEFQQIGEEGEAGGNSLDMLMDIRLPIAVELGRTQMLVRDILDYGPGTVIELDKLAGDPVDVLVNGKIVAQGEVVVADDHFGVRITTLLSPHDRVRSLA